MVSSAYIGYEGYDSELFFKLLLGSCILAGFFILLSVISNVMAFKESEGRTPERLRTVDPLLDVFAWSHFDPERWGLLMLRSAAVFTIMTFILGLMGIALGYVISSITRKKMVC